MDNEQRTTRRAVIAGAAAATTAGAAYLAADAWAPSQSGGARGPVFASAAGPNTSAPSGSGGDGGHVYVSASGSDSRDGLSPGTAVRTIQKGISLAQSGVVHVGAGEFSGPIVLDRVRVQGSGGDATRIVASSATEPVVTMKDRSFLSNLRVYGGPSFRGTLLDITGTACHISDVDIKNDDQTKWQNGFGGTGIHLHGNESCQFSSIWIEQVTLGILLNSSNHTFENLRGSSCFKILIMETDDPTKLNGRHVFVNSKFVHCGYSGTSNPAQIETILISADGSSCFFCCDWDESDNSLHTVKSHHNTFVGCDVAPGCAMMVSGDHNEFRNQLVQGTLHVTGSNNDFYAPRAPYSSPRGGPAFVVDGSQNLVWNETLNYGLSGSGILRLATK